MKLMFSSLKTCTPGMEFSHETWLKSRPSCSSFSRSLQVDLTLRQLGYPRAWSGRISNLTIGPLCSTHGRGSILRLLTHMVHTGMMPKMNMQFFSRGHHPIPLKKGRRSWHISLSLLYPLVAFRLAKSPSSHCMTCTFHGNLRVPAQCHPPRK